MSAMIQFALKILVVNIFVVVHLTFKVRSAMLDVCFRLTLSASFFPFQNLYRRQCRNYRVSYWSRMFGYTLCVAPIEK